MIRSLRRSCVLLLALTILVAAGCGSDESITTYKVPRSTEREAKPRTAAYRILGALFPANDPVWYFKFSGSAAQVDKHEAEFDKLTASVKLAADPSRVPSFELPAGWTKTGPRNRGGFTTDEVLKIDSTGAPLEVTITNNPGGGLNQNLKRWADQVDADFDPNDVAALARPFDANGCKGLRVDLRGPKNPAGGPMMKPR